MLAKMSVDQALMKAKSHIKNNEITEAQKLYQTVLLAFPHNKRAQEGLASLNKPNHNNSLKSPSQDAINQLMSLYNQGQLSLVVQQAKDLTEQYPKEFIIWNILGVSAAQIGELDQAITSFQKVISLNPDCADAYSNMGLSLHSQGKMNQAIAAYKKAYKYQT